MPGSKLKLTLLSLLSFLLSAGVCAQQNRFLYVQTENNQPFYVKMDKQVFTSSDPGFLIIPALTDRLYHFVIGFPQSGWAEMDVTVDMRDANAGFLLKYYGEKEWGLSNLQTLQLLVMQKSAADPRKKGMIKTGGFAAVLATVVNDPALAEVTFSKIPPETVPVPPEKTAAVIPAAIKTLQEDSASLHTDLAEKEEIIKLSRDSTSGGLLLAYRYVAATGTDTINVFFPVNIKLPVSENDNEQPVPVTENGKENAAKKDTRFIDMELRNPNVRADSGVLTREEIVVTEKKQAAVIRPVTVPGEKSAGQHTGNKTARSNCKAHASQGEFLKLHQLMAEVPSEENMIQAAGKQFIDLCFTTGQVKVLGDLFINESAKYKFFVAAFPHVSDLENFSSLEEQLTESYYKTRFKAMLSH